MQTRVRIKYDEQMHAVICAAKGAIHGREWTWAFFNAPVFRATGEPGLAMSGCVLTIFVEIEGRARHAMLILWGGYRYLFASEGQLLFRLGDDDPVMQHDDLFAPLVEANAALLAALDILNVKG